LKRGLDSTLNNLEEYNFIQRSESEYYNLGNTGTAAYPLLYNPIKRKGFNNGMDAFDLYWMYLDSIRYYDLKRPYTELGMNIGLRQELNFKGTHSQNITPQFNFGVQFNRIFSVGYFQHQKATVNSFSVYGRYTTKNERFSLLFAGAFNSARVQENGGVTTDYLSDAAALITKQEAFVNTTTAENFYRSIHGKITASYRLGYSYEVKVNDTTTLKKIQPMYSVEYTFGMGRDRYNYSDKSPDSLFYLDYYQGKDSAYYFMENRRIKNEVWFRFLGYKKIAGGEGKAINIVAGAGLVHENHEVKQDVYEYTTNNTSVQGYIRSNALSAKRLTYHATGAFYFSGYNIGDVEVKGGAGYAFKKLGAIRAGAVWSLRQPTWLENHYHSPRLDLTNNFSKVNTVGINASYFLPYTRTKIEANYYIINGLIYWNKEARPVQVSPVVNVLNLQLVQNFYVKQFHLDNYVSFQYFSNTEAIRAPMVFAKSSFYYENFVFKKAMLLRVGVESRYSTDFYANAYAPLVGQFYNQDDYKMHYLPTLDVFVNFRVKTVRVFLKGNNLLQGVGIRSYYGAYLYPADERSFKGGVSWRFLD
jgi:hypothetical protein